jgi:hypothetical protein
MSRSAPSSRLGVAYHGLHCGKAIVMPNRTVVCGATGASCRYAIHSPLTKTLMGGNPSRIITYPTPKLNGTVVDDPPRQLIAQVASPDLE